MNFYILINLRKIRSKDTTKDNFIKIPLIDVGLKGEKKYIETIVNDIQMHFSIKLIQKSMNYKKNENESDIKITIKSRGMRINRRNIKSKPNNSFEKKKSFGYKTKIINI